ncbi:MAG: type II toxin-antitoxin system VapC family toxin [Gemmatimonadota bacterium]
MTVADSDVLIDALAGREPAATRVRSALETSQLATTTVSLFELLSGARGKGARGKVEKLLAALTILPFDAPAGRAAAEARRQPQTRGSSVGMADYLIAGICLSRSLPLLTRNRAHFERISGLRLAELTEP